MKHVLCKKGQTIFLGREDLLVREEGEELFARIMDDGERGKIFGEQEALITEDEYQQWSESFELMGDVPDEKVRGITSIPNRRNRMQKHQMDRVMEMASRA